MLYLVLTFRSVDRVIKLGKPLLVNSVIVVPGIRSSKDLRSASFQIICPAEWKARRDTVIRAVQPPIPKSSNMVLSNSDIMNTRREDPRPLEGMACMPSDHKASAVGKFDDFIKKLL